MTWGYITAIEMVMDGISGKCDLGTLQSAKKQEEGCGQIPQLRYKMWGKIWNANVH